MERADIATRLNLALQPGNELPRSSFAPGLSYGRHRGPARRDARIAAVALTLFQNEADEWMIPLTLRPMTLQHHGGQICLPGGRVEPGEAPIEAALREFEEELGVRPSVLQHCGELATQYVYASNNLVHPIVAVIDRPDRSWQPDPVEVAEVILLPLVSLLSSEERGEVALRREVRQQDDPVGEMVFRAPAFRYRSHSVWGATALILDQLARILHSDSDSQ